MPDTITRPAFRWEWNINTIAVLVGFAAGFITWGYTLSELRTGREQDARNIERLATEKAALEARVELIAANLAKQDQFDYRLAQVEKNEEAVDARIGRITESYSNQFSDMRTQLSSISTQIALTNQTLQRIEATQPTNRQ
jgi:septation ring formation regulator EzrA